MYMNENRSLFVWLFVCPSKNKVKIKTEIVCNFLRWNYIQNHLLDNIFIQQIYNF